MPSEDAFEYMVFEMLVKENGFQYKKDGIWFIFEDDYGIHIDELLKKTIEISKARKGIYVNDFCVLKKLKGEIHSQKGFYLAELDENRILLIYYMNGEDLIPVASRFQEDCNNQSMGSK